MSQLDSKWWSFVTAVVLIELVALALIIYLGRLRRRRVLNRRGSDQSGAALRRDPKWVAIEIDRLCSGHHSTEPMIKQMSAEDRALFEVSVIDALNTRSREGQHRLRSSLIKYGYDEQCARRVMSEDLSDRVRATALLTLLRPQWREESAEQREDEIEQRTSKESSLRAAAASRSIGGPDCEGGA